MPVSLCRHVIDTAAHDLRSVHAAWTVADGLWNRGANLLQILKVGPTRSSDRSDSLLLDPPTDTPGPPQVDLSSAPAFSTRAAGQPPPVSSMEIPSMQRNPCHRAAG